MNKRTMLITLGIICMFLTIGICIQLKTINLANQTVSKTFNEDKLRDEVLKLKEQYDNTYSQLENAEKELEKVRKKATENSSSSGALEEEIKLTNRLLGLTELTGKGIILVLEDNKTLNVDGVTSGNIVDYIIHDEDLIVLLNELKNCGAEAISINQQRIVNTTGITCDGLVIRINGQKVSAPYEIRAIGSPERLMGIDTLGSYKQKLDQLGLIKEFKKSNNITIPKYEGTMNFQYLRNVE